jgi:hypothetical protein
LRFRATQERATATVKAKTSEEATKKLAGKLSAGIEIKFLKIGGEASEESEHKEAFEKEVEWVAEGGKPEFKEIKQL